MNPILIIYALAIAGVAVAAGIVLLLAWLAIMVIFPNGENEAPSDADDCDAFGYDETAEMDPDAWKSIARNLSDLEPMPWDNDEDPGFTMDDRSAPYDPQTYRDRGIF